MSAIDDFLEQLVEQVELGRGIRLFVRRQAEETQIAAGLPQAQQTGEHLHASCAVSCAAFPDALLNLAQKRVVGRRAGLDQARTEATCSIFSGSSRATSDLRRRSRNGRKRRASRRCSAGVEGSVVSGLLVAFAKIGPAPEIAGHDEIHKRPKIAHRVFHWGAGENEAMARAEAESRLRILRLGILDVLRFIEDDGGKRETGIKFDIASEQAVAR